MVSSFAPLLDVPHGHAGPERWYVVRQSELLVADDGSLPDRDPATVVALGDDPAVFVGLDGDVACWAVGAGDGVEAPAGWRWQPLWVVGLEWPKPRFLLAGRAVQLVEWGRTSRFCGRCGTATEVVAGERARHCPACGLTAYPRLAPAVIVLVRRGEQALLAAGRGFRNGMRSALAGFVEPGEDLEEAVRREVAEEVGITLGDVRYVGSQPWPFPHSLMIGFEAEWEAGELRPDGVEILDAAWYDRHDLPPIPPPMSIARELIDRWLEQEPARVGGPPGG
jgi:NAD+ diphosphatase